MIRWNATRRISWSSVYGNFSSGILVGVLKKDIEHAILVEGIKIACWFIGQQQWRLYY